MFENYKKEVPKARINITLQAEGGDVRKRKELPLKLLMLGNFSGNYNDSAVSEVKRLNVNKENLDHVVKEISPQVKFQITDNTKKECPETLVELTFEKMKDFHPDQIILKIPALRKLLAMRNLLKDLKIHLLDDPLLRKELEKLLSCPENLQKMREELQQRVARKEYAHD